MKNEIFVAKTYAGVENLLYDELIALGAKNAEIINRGVRFEGDFSLLYRANYFCRTALRILWQVKTFRFTGNQQFYKELFDFPSERYLAAEGTLAVSATLHESIFSSPLFASVLAKDAICDRFREKYDRRPSVDKEDPDLQFHLHIYHDEATLFLDSSGESLHKRGYKVSSHPATLNEVVAAAMVKLTGWEGESDVIDFMCGSGTLLIEAAMSALCIPAGFYRQSFGFFSWLNYDRELWNAVVDEARIKEDIPVDFYGYDISPRFLGMAKANVREADLADFIRLKNRDMKDTKPVRMPSLVLVNPPYGERLKVDDLKGLYGLMGDTLKKEYHGCTAWILSSDMEALKSVGLHPSRKYTLFNGKLECKLMKFELYQGSKKTLQS